MKTLKEELVDTCTKFINSHQITDEDLAQDLYIVALQSNKKNINRRLNYRLSKEAKKEEKETQDFEELDFIMGYRNVLNNVIPALVKSEINQIAKRKLTGEEHTILIDYYGLYGQPALSLREIGEKYNITKDKAKKIKDRAIKKLSSDDNCRKLVDYLDN